MLYETIIIEVVLITGIVLGVYSSSKTEPIFTFKYNVNTFSSKHLIRGLST